jgi:hypothetical protein
MLRPKKKISLSTFSRKDNFLTTSLLELLFLLGLVVSILESIYATLIYVGLWVFSYFVVYAGACRGCVYYGKSCPVPLEGTCVHHVFKFKKDSFGYHSLVWASFAYLLRVSVPLFLIITRRLYVFGFFYVCVIAVFWFIHLRISGCPHCINKACPLNPEYRKSKVC